ncbi:MAG: ATP-binding cassette, subfamily bacterial MsbA [Abditibacteriota bacterium]|nr:ATP-binding cassette, subfamily bacterial MsbA [Abditibacteriota bacterium]
MGNLRRLAAYLKPHRNALALSMVCMVLSGALSTAFLFLFQQVLKQILQSNDLSRLNWFMVIVIGWAGARVSVDFAMNYLTQRTGQRALAHLRRDLFVHFQSLSVGFFESRRTGEIMSRMTNDLIALQTVLTFAVISAIRAPVEAVGSLGYMFWADWQLSLGVLLVLPPMAFLINRAGTRIRRATSQLQTQLAELTNYLQEKISAMRVIQTFGTRDYEIELFERVNDDAYRKTMKPIRIQASLAPTIEFIGYVGVLILLWFGARRGMSSDALITYLFAMHRAAMNLKAVASLNNMFKGAESSAERLFEMLDTQPEVRDAPDAIDLQKQGVRGHLQFENVRFAYGDGPDVLHDISFDIKPGEVVALAGLSGSGKSTIAALVPRLYDPSAGSVALDGFDLRAVTMKSLRAHIGAVPQETTLFHGTIRDNIAYGRPDATDAEILHAARDAHADEFVSKMPQGYDTPIGERGGKLSGGQRQRLAIARALLRDPKLLILDEATSALDAESESLVQDALAKLMQGRTTLIIAHRFSTIQNADRILVLDGGRIVETGTHSQLLASRGLYYRLYQMQSFVSHADHELNASDQTVPNLPAPLALAPGASA